MQIERIRLVNFRNYERLDLQGFGSGINMICGPNAQGKTNLLEAIYVTANGKSFRFTQERAMIREGRQMAYSLVGYTDAERSHSLEMMIGADMRKSYKLDSEPAHAIKEIIGQLLMVSFSPEDIRTANEGPRLRRSLLDSEISKIVPTYVDALRRYTSIVQEKNKVLKRPDNPETDKLVHVYNEQAVPCIATILKNRRKYIENLNKYVTEVQKEISGGHEDVRLQYRSGIDEGRIAYELEAATTREKQAMCSVIGPHRDDILISLNGKDVKQFASQGQLRSVMLSVKVACLRALRDATKRTPILLLDDVFSELDPKRKQNLVHALDGMQTFVTTADPAEAHLTKEAPIISVQGGKASLTA